MPRGNPVGPAPRIMGTFKEGGDVPKTGHYKLHEGEKVITKNQKDQMSHAFGLAQSHLAHEKAPEPEHKMPRKKLKSVHTRRAKNGGFIMKHEHHAPHNMQEHDSEHTAGTEAEMLQHMKENQPEAPPDPEEMGESGGAAQMEQAIGMK